MRKQGSDVRCHVSGKSSPRFGFPWNLKPNTYNRRGQRGFTLLLAALVASIVLSLGAAVFGIAQKQLTLSAIGRDSQFAFYAADTAAECALYWDFRFGYFGSTTPPSVVSPNPRCDDQTMLPFTDTGDSTVQPYNYAKTSSRVDFFKDASPAGGYCAEFVVKKCQGTFTAEGTCAVDASKEIVRTLVHADGYSVNCASIQTSLRALQRSVELHY